MTIPNTKMCSGCKEIKEFSEFTKQKDKKYGLSCACKSCIKKRRETPEQLEKTKILQSNYRAKNLEYLQEQSRKNYKNNRDKNLQNKKEYYQANREEKLIKQKTLYIKNKDKRKIYNKKYYKENKLEIQKSKNKLKRNKRKNDVKYKIYSNISNAIYVSLKGKKNFKKWVNIVGYSLDELKIHLESKFTEVMTWENYGVYGWHIDHIIPQSFFKYKSYDCLAFKECWALKNLQPLWATSKIAIENGEDICYVGNFDKNNKITITKEVEEYLNNINNGIKNEKTGS